MPLELKFFTLKPRSDSPDDVYALASRMAMLTYADVIEAEDRELANGLRDWVKREETEQLLEL